jgi:hypothetical protein
LKKSIAIYLDTGWGAGSSFDYSVASNNSSGSQLRDFIFHVANIGGSLEIGASNNSSDALLATSLINPYTVTSSGRYVFQQTFYNNGGQPAVDMNLFDASMSTLLFSQTLTDSADTIPGVVGGHRYGWFTLIDVPGGTASPLIACH